MKQTILRGAILVAGITFAVVAAAAKPPKPPKSTCDDCNVCRVITIDVQDANGAPVPNLALRVGVSPDYNPGAIMFLGNAFTIMSPYRYNLCLGDPTTAVSATYEISSNSGSPFIYERVTHTPPPAQDVTVKIVVKPKN